MSNLKRLTEIERGVFAIILAVLTYLFILIVVNIINPTTMHERMMGTRYVYVNLFAAIISAIVAALIFIHTKPVKKRIKAIKKIKGDEKVEILKKGLTEDEFKVVNEIKNAKEITQSSLRFRLDWSKTKVSLVISQLEKKGIIEREKVGKTYKVRLSHYFRK